MKKTMKILSIMLLVMTIVATASNVFASSIIGDIENATNNANVDNATGKLVTTVGTIIKMIRNVAVIAGVLIIVILGFKYMMGSVEEKAGYQKSFIPLIVGIVIIMGATSIASFLFGLF